MILKDPCGLYPACSWPDLRRGAIDFFVTSGGGQLDFWAVQCFNLWYLQRNYVFYYVCLGLVKGSKSDFLALLGGSNRVLGLFLTKIAILDTFSHLPPWTPRPKITQEGVCDMLDNSAIRIL